MPTISHTSLREYGAAIFAAAGFPADQGRDVTDHLVDSNLVGHDSPRDHSPARLHQGSARGEHEAGRHAQNCARDTGIGGH